MKNYRKRIADDILMRKLESGYTGQMSIWNSYRQSYRKRQTSTNSNFYREHRSTSEHLTGKFRIAFGDTAPVNAAI